MPFWNHKLLIFGGCVRVGWGERGARSRPLDAGSRNYAEGPPSIIWMFDTEVRTRCRIVLRQALTLLLLMMLREQLLEWSLLEGVRGTPPSNRYAHSAVVLAPSSAQVQTDYSLRHHCGHHSTACLLFRWH